MTFHCIVSHGMVLYLFDIIAVYCMSPHYILWYGMVLYFIWSYCTVSHCYVSLLQRADELPRSASGHFILYLAPLEQPWSSRFTAEIVQSPMKEPEEEETLRVDSVGGV